MEQAEPCEANAHRSFRLKAAQDEAAQYLCEQRYEKAKRALNLAATIQAEEMKSQRRAAAQTERENALRLTHEGKYAEARQALTRADEVEALAELAIESSALVNRYAKVAAGVGFLPLPFFDFAAILLIQVLLVRRIAYLFGHTTTKEQIRGLVLSLVGAVIPTGVGQGIGAALSLSSLPVLVSGAVVYFVATPLMAYALTRAVGSVFIRHFERGGTLLTFDPQVFNEYFVNEFRKAGGILRKANKPASVASVPVA